MEEEIARGRALVAEVRRAAQAHGLSWAALVPNPFEINLGAEAAEEEAYADMARARAALRDHIRETYGLSSAELGSLARP